MKLPKLVKIYTVRIVYKSGYTHDFECTSFSIKDGNWKWVSDSVKHRPVDISVGGVADNISAVWQLGYRHSLRLV